MIVTGSDKHPNLLRHYIDYRREQVLLELALRGCHNNKHEDIQYDDTQDLVTAIFIQRESIRS